MKTIIRFTTVVVLLIFAACSGGEKQQKQTESLSAAPTETVDINPEAKALLTYLDDQGDYVNGRNFPSILKPSSVFEELDSNMLVLDLRSAGAFSNGHIKNAKNVEFSHLPEYFKNEINPGDYNRVVLVCYAGQISGYATSLLRLAGYDNVYSMKWGMSGWNKKFADEAWSKEVSSEFQDKLEMKDNEPAEENDFPKLNAGTNSGKQILGERIDSLFDAGYSDVFITSEKVFQQPENYYVINYDRKDKYESGHIPGAVRYKPDATLGIVSEMQTIPADEQVVVYCNTGQNSGFVTAYLRLFGYDAKSLLYGNNSFMHNKMVEQKDSLSWIPFTSAESEDYPYVKN